MSPPLSCLNLSRPIMLCLLPDEHKAGPPTWRPDGVSKNVYR
jgi:hypothetical protein